MGVAGGVGGCTNGEWEMKVGVAVMGIQHGVVYGGGGKSGRWGCMEWWR